jgi:hypothetical protein
MIISTIFIQIVCLKGIPVEIFYSQFAREELANQV